MSIEEDRLDPSSRTPLLIGLALIAPCQLHISATMWLLPTPHLHPLPLLSPVWGTVSLAIKRPPYSWEDAHFLPLELLRTSVFITVSLLLHYILEHRGEEDPLPASPHELPHKESSMACSDPLRATDVPHQGSWGPV